MSLYDVLVIGAGFAGAVTAGQLARKGNKRILVLEQRGHVGGNSYDCLDACGVLIHQYGPHIFHTNNKRVYEYLSQYTQWNNYQHRVVTNIPWKDGARIQYPVPFNLTSLESAFGLEKGRRLGDKLLKTYGAEKKITILEMRQNPDPDIFTLADYVYKHVFVSYTMKQWGQKPEDIDPATTARVPVFLSRDDRYFQDEYQGLPVKGYTSMFEEILEHPNITTILNAGAESRLALRDGKTFLDGEEFGGPVIFTGALDEFFDLRFGRLPYRTLDFEFETWVERGQTDSAPAGCVSMLKGDFFQSHGTVNYTMDRPYTRITEFKHLTGQNLPGITTIMKEFSREYTGTAKEIPYYAIINETNNIRYSRYAELAAEYPNLYLIGRLAEYKYYNMDAIVERALILADKLLKR